MSPSTSTPATLTPTLLGTAALGLVVALARPRDRDALRAMLRPHATEGAPSPRTPGVPTITPAPEPPLPPRWTPATHAATAPFPFLANPVLAASTEHALDAFARRLSAAAETRRTVRVLHLGDSLIADDRITGRLRRRLQHEFGDGGLGMVFLRPTARSYHPAGVRFDARGWYPGSVVGPLWEDGGYGVGGTGFEAPDAGPTATLDFDRGRRFAVRARRDPAGGALRLRLDEGPWVTARTDGEVPVLVADTDGVHSVTVRAAGGRVRVYGVVALREGSGVTVENLGTVSSSAQALLHIDEAHWTAALAAEDPALVILSLGTNEASHGALGPTAREALRRDTATLYRRVRAALPHASCLVTAPPDAAVVLEDGSVAPRPALAAIVAAEADGARDAGCAFFDTLAWMGGHGSITRWQRTGLADGDLTHLTDAGGARVGDVLADALLHARDDAMARGER